MTCYFGSIDASAIVMDHCRDTKQDFKHHVLDEDPRTTPNGLLARWVELNWNHRGHLNGGDEVYFQDTKGVFWKIFIGPLPAPKIPKHTGEYNMRAEQAKNRDERKAKQAEDVKKAVMGE